MGTEGTINSANNSFEVGGFIHSRAGVKHPDIQYHFFPMAVRYDGKSPNNSHGFQAHVGPLLALIAFPTATAVGEVSADTIFNLGLIYGPLVMVIYLGACVAINRYNISRADHSTSLARLEEM